MKKLFSILILSILVTNIPSSIFASNKYPWSNINDVVKVKEMTRGAVEFSEERIRVVYRKGANIPDEAVIVNKFTNKGVTIALLPVKHKSIDNDSLGVVSTVEERISVEDTLIDVLSDPDVISASPDYLSKVATWTDNGTQAYPDDFDLTATNNHWNYDSSNLREMWHNQGCPGDAKCGGDSSVVVAVIDTGLAYEAYDDSGTYGFTGNNFTSVSSEFTTGFNLYSNSGETADDGLDNDCNGIIDDYNGVDMFAFSELETSDIQGGEPLSERTCNLSVPVDFSGVTDLYRRKPGHPVDTDGHGSMVTGLIAGVVDNGGDTISPAFDVSIMPLAVSVNAVGSSYTGQTYYESDYTYIWSTDVANAIDYAGVMGVDIINLSVADLPYDALFETWYIDYWYDEGITFIGSSGNDSSLGSMQPITYPAAYDNVISVGAVNLDNSRSEYSNGGSNLDLVSYVGQGSTNETAIYQETVSCYPSCPSNGPFNAVGDKYAIGTSFAAPQVTAAAAIIKSYDNTFAPSVIKTILVEATTDINTPGFDEQTGNGVLDFSRLPTFDLSSAQERNFTIYRWKDGDMAWVWVGNPSSSNPANFLVKVNGVAMSYHRLDPSETKPLHFRETFDGPVEIFSDSTVNITQKIITVAGKLNEQVAITDSQYDTTFYYPIYRFKDGDKAWIWIANPSLSTTANVSISIGGISQGNIQVQPNTLTPFSVNGLFDGFVEINSDINIFTTLKSLTGGGINEFKGISPSETDTTFYYPIYRWASGDKAWIWVGNPDPSNDANIDVTLAGSAAGSYVIPAGENIFIKYEDTFSGPLKIVSDRAVFSTLKSRVGGVINEFPGIRPSDLSTSIYYPIYRWTAGDKSWIWIGNPDPSNDANVDVTIAGSLAGSYVVPAGENIYVKYEGLFDGPIEISSDIAIYSTLKSLVNGSINEFTGIK